MTDTQGRGLRRGRGRAVLGAALSLTYISASRHQHSCQQAEVVGIHLKCTHTRTHTAVDKYFTNHKMCKV